MPFGVAAAAIGAGTAIYGASQQKKAMKKGAQQANQASEQGIGLIQGAQSDAIGYLGQGMQDAIGYQREMLPQALAYQDQGLSEAIGYQREARDQVRSDFQPYMGAGTQALGGMTDAAGLNGVEGRNRAVGAFQTSPGYEFQVKEGMRATTAAANAQGLSNPGATLKAFQARGQELANADFGQYYNRLAGLAQMGMAATGQVGNATMGAANAMGGYTMNAANAKTGATMGSANAMGGYSMSGASGMAGASMSGANSMAALLGGQGQTAASLASANANIQGNMIQGVGNAAMGGLNAMYGQRSNSLYNPQGSGGSWFG